MLQIDLTKYRYRYERVPLFSNQIRETVVTSRNPNPAPQIVLSNPSHKTAQCCENQHTHGSGRPGRATGRGGPGGDGEWERRGAAATVAAGRPACGGDGTIPGPAATAEPQRGAQAAGLQRCARRVRAGRVQRTRTASPTEPPRCRPRRQATLHARHSRALLAPGRAQQGQAFHPS